MKHILLLPVCALIGSSGALAQQDRDAPNWVRIKTENEGNTSTFVDLKSIRSGNGYRQAWAKEVFKANGSAIKEIRVQYEFDCKYPALRILGSRVQLQNGSVEDQALHEGWLNILPDDTSGLKALHVAVCGARVRT
jgi:hypothetical protein